MEKLDFFLVSSHLSTVILLTDIDPAFMSDHAVPTLNLKNIKQEGGPRYWKLNLKLLQNEEFLEGVKQIIDQNVNKYTGHSYSQMSWN